MNTDAAKSNARAAWLTAGALSLALPVFVPSFGWLNPFTDVIGMANLVMFALSFPSSVVAIPWSYSLGSSLGIEPNTMGGRYLAVWVMFLLGAIQWFWLVPKLGRAIKERRKNELAGSADSVRLNESPEFDAARTQTTTPLERALND